MPRRSAAVVVCALALAACVVGPARVPEPPRDATIILTGDAPEARVYLDDRLLGWLRDLAGKPLRVVHGAHRVEVRADGRYTAYLDVPVAHDETRTVPVKLVAVPRGEAGD